MMYCEIWLKAKREEGTIHRFDRPKANFKISAASAVVLVGLLIPYSAQAHDNQCSDLIKSENRVLDAGASAMTICSEKKLLA